MSGAGAGSGIALLSEVNPFPVLGYGVNPLVSNQKQSEDWYKMLNTEFDELGPEEASHLNLRLPKPGNGTAELANEGATANEDGDLDGLCPFLGPGPLARTILDEAQG
ncbi:hypothetical protein F5Y13DRAFT_190486 [Hypoxylon sp. FL1857]|nr:hypothetical protein F5Y13DRAFT_190486 [Hypoxylon sp. FL1857]